MDGGGVLAEPPPPTPPAEEDGDSNTLQHHNTSANFSFKPRSGRAANSNMKTAQKLG